MDIILLELLHYAFYALLRLRMAAEQTIFGAAALLRQIIKLPHRNQHAIRIKAGSNGVFHALLIRTALVGTAVAGKKCLLRCLHKAHALALRRYNKYQRGPHLLFNRVHCMLFRYVTNLMAQNAGKLSICRHIIYESLINVDKAAGTSQCIDLIAIQHLEGIGQLVAAAHLRQSLADIIHALLQIRILQNAILRLQRLRRLAPHLYFILQADHASLCLLSANKEAAGHEHGHQKT